MAHHRRKKSRRSVRCTLCTPHRWQGNGKARFSEKEKDQRSRSVTEARDAQLQANYTKSGVN